MEIAGKARVITTWKWKCWKGKCKSGGNDGNGGNSLEGQDGNGERVKMAGKEKIE